MKTNNEPGATAASDVQARMVEILLEIEDQAPGAIQRMRTAFAAGLPGLERIDA